MFVTNHLNVRRSIVCSSSVYGIVSVLTIKMPKGASVASIRGVLMLKILNTCILSILVCTLFLARQRNISIRRNISIHGYIGCLHEIEIIIYQKI